MTRTLSCGPARLVLEGDRLRHLHLDGVEAIRGLMLQLEADAGGKVSRVGIGVPGSSEPLTMSTSCPAMRMYRLKTSEGTPKPATWPRWRGPLA